MSNGISRRTMLNGMVGFSTAIILQACSNHRVDSTANTAEPLKIGANVGNTPWEFKNELGELVGFEVDLMKAVGQRLGRAVEFVNLPFTELFPAVLSNRIHAAVSSITITQERLKTLDFAQPYYDSDQSLTVVADSGIASLADLRGKTVAVDSGSTGDTWAQAHLKEYGFATIRRYEGLNPAMMDLNAGEYDGYISDIPSLLYYVKDKPRLKVTQRIPTGEQYSVMFAKGNVLRNQVNDIITVLKGDGTLTQIHQQWFGVAPEPQTSTLKVLPVPAFKGQRFG